MKGTGYDPALTAYFPPLWDILFNPWVREMFLVAGPQIGKTLFGQGFLARRGVERPGPRQVALPDETLTEDWFNKKLIPLFQDSPKLKRYVGTDRNSVVKTEIYTEQRDIVHRAVDGVRVKACVAVCSGRSR